MRASNFALLWAGQTISSFGNEITRLALPVVAISSLGASTADIGILRAAGYLPFLALGLPAGVWIMGSDRRRVMIASDIGRSMVLVLLFGCVALGFANMPLLWLAAVSVGILAVPFEVAYASYPPSLVSRQRLLWANSRLESSASAARLFGPAVGGILVTFIAATGALLVDAMSFLVSAGSIGAIRARDERASRADRRIVRDLQEGLAYVRNDPILLPLIICAALYAVFDSATWTVLPVVLLRDLGRTPAELGVVLAAAGVGLVTGNAFANRIARRHGTRRVLIGGACVAVVGRIALAFGALAGNLWFMVAAALLGGIGEGTFAIPYITLRQIAPPELLTRVVSVFRTVVWGAIPAGGLLVATLGTWLSPTAVFLIAGVLIGTCLVPLASQGLRGAEARIGASGSAADVPVP